MADALESRIIDNVVSTLQAIDGTGDWHVDVAAVRRMMGSTATDLRVPGIAVVHNGAQLTEKRLTYDAYRLGLILSLALPGHTANYDAALRNFASDCQAALLADESRGGLAIWTTVDSVEVYDKPEGASFAVAEVTVEIEYRIDPRDPTTNPYLS